MSTSLVSRDNNTGRADRHPSRWRGTMLTSPSLEIPTTGTASFTDVDGDKVEFELKGWKLLVTVNGKVWFKAVTSIHVDIKAKIYIDGTGGEFASMSATMSEEEADRFLPALDPLTKAADIDATSERAFTPISSACSNDLFDGLQPSRLYSQVIFALPSADAGDVSPASP